LYARDNALEEMKKVNNRTAQGNPPKPKIKPPVINAAQAPLLESEPARHASTAIRIARRKPINICIENVNFRRGYVA
jgi:hypothetical protein